MPPKRSATDELSVKRTNVIAKLDRFEDYLNQFNNNVNIIQLKLRLNKLEEIWREFENVQLEIEQFPATIQQDEQEIRNQFENKYFELSARAEELVGQHTVETISTNTHETIPLTTYSNQNHVKLPIIELPKFNGNYQYWTQFHDTFKSLIHNVTNLTAIEKFHYLKSSLHGEAANVIDSLAITTDNYEVAWNLINKRYENKRLIVQHHVNALLELPVITKEAAGSLRQLSDNFQKHIRALEALKQPVDMWDGIIIPLLCSKFDNNTKREWESAQDSTEIPKLKDLVSFLNKRCQILEVTNTKQEFKYMLNTNKINKLTSHVSTNNKINCAFCKGQHYIFKCTNFLKLTNKERLKEIKNLKLCINCFRDNHFSNDCKSSSCRTCGKRHNTLVHTEQTNSQTQNEVEAKSKSEGIQQTCCSNTSTSQVILSTAVVYIFDAAGNVHECRALLDSGSQSHFISEDFCHKLKLPCHNLSQQFPISGIGQSTTQIKNCTQAKIKSRFNGFQTTIKCLVLPKITENIPNIKINSSDLNIPRNIKLADYTYDTPGSIDLLIGADLFYHILCVGQIQFQKNQPILQKTKLGWIISGTLSQDIANNNKSSCFLNVNQDLENQIAKFWSIEELENKTHLSKTELECERHFVNNTTRHSDGRYIVKLPTKENIETLGDSYSNALKRFHLLENRLQQNESLKLEYIHFMREYEELNHMSLVNNEAPAESKTYYLPHHAVIKDSSNTTRVRVVFDGSAKTSSDISLNDTLLVGRTTQDDLINILIRFRTYQIVFTADIEKMYRQIKVHPDDINLQRIIWREDPSQPLKIYTLNTVTYGTSSAPFLAIRSLKQLALDEGQDHPKAAEVLMTNFYVDDCLTGAATIEEAKELKHELTELLKKGQFILHKWKSNDTTLSENQQTQENVNLPLSLDNDQPVKTLGLYWNPAHDTLQYTITYKEPKRISKREILSLISQIFDPLGLLGPIITISKIIMQQLWQLKLDWDETIPLSLYTKWQTYYKDLISLNNIKIPRKLILSTDISSFEIHGFSDASEHAYGACIYMKTIYNNSDTHVILICSKSRVAPLKSLSVPRLELCAALLLSKLSQRVRKAMSLDIKRIFHWTDSSIVLAWIQTSPHLLKQFIANRISEIQNLSDAIHWKHVPSHDNPADLLSRGIFPNQIAEKEIWWNGPTWLKQHESHWPTLNIQSNFSNEELETRKTVNLVTTTKTDFSILDRYSFSKLKRVIAWCFRFKFNALNKNNKSLDALSTRELQQAETAIIKLLQQQHFDSEIKTLQRRNTIDKSSRLINLSPFLDDEGVIRVGGRLKNAYIPYNQKHPVVLPAKCNITESLLKEEHILRFHCGPQSLLAFIRLKYWPLSAKNTIRKITRNCITCFRSNPRPSAHIMGNLPESRTIQGKRPFYISGVDYCGPFSLIESKGRGRKRVVKCYVAIFICFSTKAVHLEPVSELTGEAFLAVLKRFTSRRGLCSELYSDNGTNFIKANNDLNQLFDFLKQQKGVIATELAKQNITWHFNPPRSPHFGGLWESAVKLFKYHLKRVLNLNLTYEEFNTITIQIEAIINSRPLIPQSSNLNDFTTITPAHFLIGDSLIAPIESDVSNIRDHLLSRWQHLQRIRQHFWQRWSKDYLHNLQTKSKWTHEHNNLKIGALVLLIDDNNPPQLWRTGRIIQLHPGTDGVIRVVSINTNNGVFKRAVRRICVLPNLEDISV